MKFNYKLHLYIILVMFCSFGCEQGEDTAQTQEEIDTMAPTISVANLGDAIELLTTINVSVSDDSNIVNTTININGDEVFKTSQNQFSYDIDPFQFPNGETELTIKAIDGNGNETIESHKFGLSKLLYKHDVGISSQSFDVFIAINKMQSGELITARKIINYEDLIFYAEDDFEKEELVITQYLMSKTSDFHNGRSQAGVKPGTILLTTEDREILTGIISNDFAIRDSEFTISIDDVPDFHVITIVGDDYGSYESIESPYKILYDSDITKDIFLFRQRYDHTKLLEDYRYLYINNFVNQSISFNDLSRLSEATISTFKLPNETLNYNFTLFGFNNQRSYEENLLRLLYGDAGDTSAKGFSINYPNIQEYEILKKRLQFELNDGRIVYLERKNTLNVEIPNWQIVRNENMVGINEPYDFLQFSLSVEDVDTEKNGFFTRTYISSYGDAGQIPFENLEIPLEVVSFLNDKGFNISSNQKTGKLSVKLINHENKTEYQDGLYYWPMGNEIGDVTEMIFPLNY